MQNEAGVANPWIHEVLVRVEGIQDAYGNETVEIVAYDCSSSSMKVTALEIELKIIGFDHLPRPLNPKIYMDVVQFTDKLISLQGFDPENDPFQIEFVNVVWSNSDGASIWNVEVFGNVTSTTSALAPGSVVMDAGGQILLVSPEDFGGPNVVRIVFRYRSTKNGLKSIDYFAQISVLCAVRYRYLKSEQKCVLCPPGTVCKTVGTIEPELCLLGFYSNDALTCKPCPSGSFASQPGSGSCTLCSGGYYQPSSAQSNCIPCSPGTFVNYEGAMSCKECGHFSFSGPAARTCTLCPLNTAAFTKNSANLTDCRCNEGYYESKNRAGHPCQPCCYGAICRGQRHSPFPLENFWSDKSLWNSTCYFAQCYDSGACRGYPSKSIPDITDVDDIVDLLAICDDGVEGRFCSRCKAGFWRSVGAVCMPCNLENKDKAAALYFAWFLLYVLGYFLFFYLSFSKRRVVTTLYTHNSIMFLLSKMRVKFPEVLARVFGIHAFIALDFMFLPHACMSALLGYEPLEYGQTAIFFLSLPLAMVGFVFAQYTWSKVCKLYGPYLVNRWSSKHTEEGDVKFISLILFVMSKNGEFLTDQDIQATLHHGIHSTLQGIFGIWPVLAVKSLDLLSCDSLNSLQAAVDDKTYLIANPDWICFEASHRQIFPIALLFTALYVIGLPWFLVSVLMLVERVFMSFVVVMRQSYNEIIDEAGMGNE